MGNYPLTKLALDRLWPGNVVLTDDKGLPSIMVYIPKFKNSDVLAGGDDNPHPAFIVNGHEIDGFYYSKYENVEINGAAYSLPGVDPAKTSALSFGSKADEKGAGWHISTAAEWAAIMLWCKKNGHMPKGACSGGRHYDESELVATPTSTNALGQIDRVATGTGPVTWSHDNTPSGIWDLTGNIREYQLGVRSVYGELQIIANNDAADKDNPTNDSSTYWKAINAADGSLVEPECTPDGPAVLSGSTVRMDWKNSKLVYSTSITKQSTGSLSCDFSDILCDDTISAAAKTLLKALAVLPDEGTTYEKVNITFSNHYARGAFYRGSSSGSNPLHLPFSFGICDGSNATATGGFRAAYIPPAEL